MCWEIAIFQVRAALHALRGVEAHTSTQARTHIHAGTHTRILKDPEQEEKSQLLQSGSFLPGSPAQTMHGDSSPVTHSAAGPEVLPAKGEWLVICPLCSLRWRSPPAWPRTSNPGEPGGEKLLNLGTRGAP